MVSDPLHLSVLIKITLIPRWIKVEVFQIIPFSLTGDYKACVGSCARLLAALRLYVQIHLKCIWVKQMK